MKIRILKKIEMTVILCFSLAGAWAQSEPSVGSWARLSPSPVSSGAAVYETFFSLGRLIPAPFPETVSYTARVRGLQPGFSYAVTLPYASTLSVSSQNRVDENESGGVSLIVLASGPEVDVIASVNPDVSAPELFLRGMRVRSVSDASLTLVLPWFALTLLFAFSITRVFFGLSTALRDKTRADEAFFALAGVASLLLLVAMFRYVAAVLMPFFSGTAEVSLRSVGGILFSVSSIGCIAAAKPFRGAVFLFFGAVAAGLAAIAATLVPFIPPVLPLALFSAAMVFLFSVSAVVSFSNRRGYDGVLSISAALGSAGLGVSTILFDPLLESVVACIAPLPLLVVSLMPRMRESKAPEGEQAEPVLSDYVDQVSIALTRFVPKEFLAILDKENAAELQLGDHVKKDMTIFFSDIRSFTTLSEGLTPEENFKFINSYLARVVPVVTEYGGFVDKYIGDAIMALFPHEGGADAAVRSAIEMQKRIVEYNGHRANCGYRPLSMGIGLHTGTLMLGVVGIEDRMQSTVISDAVNLASRLESITKVFNVSLAISEETFKNLADPGAYKYRFIGKVRVKGKYDPVSVFEIFDGINEELFERKMKANRFFEQGMLAYYQKDFRGAMFYFRKVIEVLPEDGAATFYLDNCLAKARV